MPDGSCPSGGVDAQSTLLFQLGTGDPLGDDLPKSDVCVREPSTSVEIRAAALTLSSNSNVLNGVPYLSVIGLVTLLPDVLTVIESHELFSSLSGC